jgi:hypothetical protein
MQPKVNRLLFPRRDDPLNLILWRLAPWLAGIEWTWIIAAIVFSPTHCGVTAPVSWFGFSISLFIPMMLFLTSLRALASGAYPRIGSLILAATNGFVLFLILFDLTRVCLEFYW